MNTKKLPVGVSDFKDMVTGDYYYVDKTLFIKEIMDKGDIMAKKIHMPQKLAVWIEARKRYRLSHAHIQMARELGMNPKRLGKKANSDQEPWKLPLPQYIEHLYHKRFGRYRPESVRSIEQLVKDRNNKKEERKKRKEERRNQVTKPVEPDEVALEDPF